MAVADHHRDARCRDCVDHGAAFGKRQRHRLFDEEMPAAGSGGSDMGAVQAVRRGDIDDLDCGIGQKIVDRFISSRLPIQRELRPRGRPRIGARDDLETPIGREGRRHQGIGAAEPDYADPQAPLCHCRRLSVDGEVGVFARDTQIMIYSARSSSPSTRSR